MQKNYHIEKIEGPRQLKSSSDSFLKQLAHDIYTGKVFTDRHITKRDKKDLGMIFLAFGLLDMIERKKFLEQKPGLIYASMEKQAPRGVNGYPCFWGFSYISIPDSIKVDQYYRQIDGQMSQYKSHEPVEYQS